MTITTNPIGYNILMWALSLLGTIITSVILPLIVKLISTKIKNEKISYVANELGTTITTAVDYTNQTFVNQLKLDGKFDKTAQEQAMLRATNYAFECLTESSKRIISSEGVDLYSLLEKKIEAKIEENKSKCKKQGQIV